MTKKNNITAIIIFLKIKSFYIISQKKLPAKFKNKFLLLQTFCVKQLIQRIKRKFYIFLTNIKYQLCVS